MTAFLEALTQQLSASLHARLHAGQRDAGNVGCLLLGQTLQIS